MCLSYDKHIYAVTYKKSYLNINLDYILIFNKIARFLKKYNKNTAKEIFIQIKELAGENIKTLLVMGNPDEIIETFGIQYLFK